jgi:hypothetical protein
MEVLFIEKGTLFIGQPTINLDDRYTDTITFSRNENPFEKVYLVHPQFIDRQYFDWIDRQGYYLLKVQPIYALEFSRGGFSSDGNKLNRARLYFTKQFNDEHGNEVRKADGFVAWANDIVRTLKKNLLLNIDTRKDYFYSQRVIAWMKDSNAEIDTPGLSIVKTT